MTIRIEVSGPEHAGKTSVVALIARLFEEQGVKVYLQAADPQLQPKLADNLSNVAARVACETIIITEMQTSK